MPTDALGMVLVHFSPSFLLCVLFKFRPLFTYTFTLVCEFMEEKKGKFLSWKRNGKKYNVVWEFRDKLLFIMVQMVA